MQLPWRPIATVIIPTFGDARFARWAIKSVQEQTVNNLEICIICDGSPEHMVTFFKDLERQDKRLRVFSFPKSTRTGEPYRDIVIRQTRGRIICYCAHDDIWLPNHISMVQQSLKGSCFTHSLHAGVDLPENIQGDVLGFFFDVDLADKRIIARMFEGENFFGLSFGAHTRKSYWGLAEGWITTPLPEVPTDLYMWRKFLTTYGRRCETTKSITALNFQFLARSTWTEQQRDDELKTFYYRTRDPEFLRNVSGMFYSIGP